MSISEQPRPSQAQLQVRDGSHFPDLCNQAERRLVKASKIQAAMTIVDGSGTPLLVYKFIGKPAGLAVTATDDLEPFHWYTPDQKTKEALDESFDACETTYLVHPKSTWFNLRPAQIRHKSSRSPQPTKDELRRAIDAIIQESARSTFTPYIRTFGVDMARKNFRKSSFESIWVVPPTRTLTTEQLEIES